MKILTSIAIPVLLMAGALLQVPARSGDDMFEKAVGIIKKYEGMSTPRHWPFVGHGHLVLPGEKFSRARALTAAEADDLLRRDLRKLCSRFSRYGRDSLILAVLAYNIGPGNVLKPRVLKKLASGERDIKESYLAHCRYRGKVLRSLQKRRAEEYHELYLGDPLNHSLNKH